MTEREKLYWMRILTIEEQKRKTMNIFFLTLKFDLSQEVLHVGYDILL